jgi:hypothetical protein
MDALLRHCPTFGDYNSAIHLFAGVYPPRKNASEADVQPHICDQIARKIATSPFESVSRTATALKTSTIDSLIFCIERSRAMTQDDRLIEQLLQHLARYRDADLASLLLHGTQLPTDTLQSWVEPATLAFLTSVSTDAWIRFMLDKGIPDSQCGWAFVAGTFTQLFYGVMMTSPTLLLQRY